MKKAIDLPKFKVILQYGAHPDVHGKSVGTPLMLANRGKNVEAITLLHQYYPLCLTFQAASVVAKECDNYHLLCLPKRIKMFIGLHDSYALDSGKDFTD